MEELPIWPWVNAVRIVRLRDRSAVSPVFFRPPVLWRACDRTIELGQISLPIKVLPPPAGDCQILILLDYLPGDSTTVPGTSRSVPEFEQASRVTRACATQAQCPKSGNPRRI